ncbi:MAG TPA: alpha-L-arabinofuranosidase C-terminal domain-containing protein, partial [Devosia sp.]
RGTALNLLVNSPGYDAIHGDNVPYVDISGVHDEEAGTLTFFAVNRNASESIDVDVSLQGFAGGKVVDHQVMTHKDLRATNTSKHQDNVVPSKGSSAKVADGTLSVKLAPYSYQMVRVKL